jgi:nucleoside-diphosphate-sugar epimerase
MKVFLTGGTGFIGQPLAHALLAQGWNVVALVRRPDSPQARSLTKMGAQCVAGDVTNRDSMRAGMQDADMVVHNAGWYEFGLTGNGRQRMHAINVTGTDNVLSLALDLGIPRSVYVSSTIFWGETGPEVCDETCQRQKPYHSYYEQSKTEAHQIAQQYQQHGLPLIIVCPILELLRRKGQTRIGLDVSPRQRDVAWHHSRELELLAGRQKRDLMSRLKPVTTSV